MNRLNLFVLFLSVFLSNCLSLSSIAQGILGRDTLICNKDELTVSSKISGNSYLWSTDETSPAITITESGKYIVSVNTPSGPKQDTITVKFLNTRFRQANNWVFGNNAGITFTNAILPIAQPKENFPAHNIAESNTNISDHLGNLLFYSNNDGLYANDGLKIYANTAPVNSALLINRPESQRFIYYFYISNNSLYYTLIDKNLNGGKGGPIANQSNQLLYNNAKSLSGFKSIYQLNTSWLISHETNSNKFITFRISNTEISAPILSATGTFDPSQISTIKISSNGGPIAVAADKAELFSFNQFTGQVGLEKSFGFPITRAVGAEFSQDGSKLYFSGMSNSESYLYQIDLFARAGDQLIYPHNFIKADINTPFGGLQLAPDNKIYIAREGQKYLSALGKPSKWLFDDNYVAQEIQFTNANSSKYLPSFPQHYFSSTPQPSVYADNGCDQTPIRIRVSTDLNLYSFANLKISINTGDASKVLNTGIKTDTAYTYSSYGKYKLAATLQTACTTMVLNYDNLVIFPQPKLSISDTTLCPDKKFLSGIIYNGSNDKFIDFSPKYAWRSTTKIYDSIATLKPENFGKYYGKVYFNDCIAIDSFEIKKFTTPTPELGLDKGGCIGDSIILEPNVGNTSGAFTWQDLSTKNKLTVSKAGIYKVSFNDGKCTTRDSINIGFYNPPANPNFLVKQIICFDSLVTINAGNNVNYTYQWNTGETTTTIKTKKSGLYSVNISNQGCNRLFNTSIEVLPALTFNFPEELPVCLKENNKIKLDAGEGVQFLWKPNLEETQTIAADTGIYSVTKKTKNGCSATKSIKVFELCEPQLHVPNAFTPNEDEENEIFLPIAQNIIAYELIIFNKWGETVFYSKDINKGWDGKHKEIQSISGGYTYVINYSAEVNNQIKEYTKKGIINLLR
ncbi:MAG: gliding motility-associated C-terminal domain-containing protein [Cytophagales bacterium]|nr:MAG: gliding motility-associated C-terminal domain-containing protein [Cytophagales bacterium]